MRTTTRPARTFKVFSRRVIGGAQVLHMSVAVGKAVFPYVVEAEGDGFGLSCRWTHATQHERSYTVVIDSDGKSLSCDCPARNGCKHQSCSEALVRTGYLQLA